MTETFNEMPKLDLHLHLDGACRTATLCELAEEFGVTLPSRNPEELQEYVTVGSECENLQEFLDCFDIIYKVLKTPEALKRVTGELCEDLERQNVVYAEIRFAPVLLSNANYSQEEFVRASIQALNEANEKLTSTINLILCLYRGRDLEDNLKTVALADRYRGEGVVGLDLAGNETKFQAHDLEQAFTRASEKNIPLTIHSGESGSSENIRTALELGADRIGHGIRLKNDESLIQYFKDHQIPLEICYTSNLQTNVVQDPLDHPVAEFYGRGLNITINTDDPSVCRTNLSQEFSRLQKQFGFKKVDILEFLENSVGASFASEETKQTVLREIDSYRKDLN